MKEKILLLLFNVLCLTYSSLAQCPPPNFPATPPGDVCGSALPLCQDIDGYCEILDANNNPSNFPGCPSNVLNNDEWFSFVACDNNLTIIITPMNCQGTGGQFGMQAAMYEGSCSGGVVATQCDCSTAPITLGGPTTPGQTYYIVLDGCAGDICEYSVTVASGTTQPCPPPDAVPEGPIMVCPGLTSTYTIPVGSADNYFWTISNPSVGNFAGPSTGTSVDINWTSEGVVDICTQGSNVCGQTSAVSCLTVTVMQPPDVPDLIQGCVYDLVECPAAPGMFVQVQPFPTTEIIPLVDAAGCNYNVICQVVPIIPETTDLGQIELCAPEPYLMCGGAEVLYNTGIYNVTCQTPQGCDSMVILDLAIFDPVAIIATPVPHLDCDPASTVQLNGANSTQISQAPGATVTLNWTGPGIVGSPTGPVITVNQPGQYCLTVTESRNGTSCTAMACVTVVRDMDIPNAPTLTGEIEPCEGITYQYDANPVGTPVPNGYGWITPPGVTFSNVDMNTIEIDWTGSTGGMLCVFGTSACGNSDTTCVAITVGELPDVPVVNGPEDVCAVNQQETYTITNAQPNVTYAWTVPNGASFNGSGSSITVNFNGANLGPGQVCATATNDCGTSAPGCFDVLVSAPPPLPAMTGPSAVCSNGTGYTYTVSNGQPTDTYNWTAPNGATINGSGSSVEIDFNGSMTGQVCVSITNECGNSNQTCINVAVQQAPVATISGGGELCEGTPENINLTITLSGAAPWTVQYTINDADTTTITVNSSPYTLTVSEPGVYELISLVGNGGCNGTVMGSATIIENPIPTAELSGMDMICENGNELGELTIELTGSAPWTVTWESNMVAQAPLNVASSPYTLNITESQAGTIILTGVTDNNGCVGTVSGSGTVIVNEAPTVSNVTRVCDPTNTTYTVTIVIQGGDPTTYSVEPENGNLAGNTFVSNPIFSGLGYNFTISDTNDCNPVVVQGSFLCDCETNSGDMDLTPVEICGDGPVAPPINYDDTNEFLDGDDVLRFILHSGNGATIVNPIVGEYTDLDNIVFNPNTMVYGTTYRLSAVVGNDDGAGGIDLNDPCLSVSLGTPVTFYEIPTAILSGLDAVCEGETAQLTVNFTGEGPWSLMYDDGSGVPISVSGINANPYTLNVTPIATGMNTICLTSMADNNCPGNVGGCGDVSVNTGVMVDGVAIECNGTATGFTVTFNITGGDPATYAVTGIPGTIANGTFTSDLIPWVPGVGFSGVVTDANDCDPQTVSQTEVICDCESDAGEMDPTLVETCGSGPAIVNAALNTVLDPDDILVYYLHTGANDVLVGVLGINNNPSFSFNPSTMSYGTTYYVSSVVGNANGMGGVDPMDQCRDIAAGTPIVFYEIPTASILGGTEICPGDDAVLMVELAGDSPWSITVNGQVYDNINNSPFPITVEPSVTTVYQLTSVTDEHCSNTLMDEQTITVHVPPTVTLDSETCNDIGTSYTVCFSITGGDISCYIVSPNTGTLTGNQFCSDPIPDGGGYSFSVSDCHGCPPAIISNPSFDCGCPTLAGDLDPTPLSICRNQMTPANIPYDDTNEFLDPDDVLCYVLYNGNVALANNSNAPVFGFNASNMVIGQVYNICPVAGNDDGSGCVDLSDPCVNIGGCVEVVFNALPTATLSGTASICQGGTANLTVNLTGTGPWDLTYQNSAGVASTVTAMSSPYNLMVSPTNSTNITLTSVTDANGCTNTITGNMAAVTVNQSPTVNPNSVTETCSADGTSFTVSFTITGGNAATYSVDPVGTITGNTFTSGPLPSPSNYTFLIDDANGCGPFVLDGNHVCPCVTAVGVMDQQIKEFCEGEMATSNYNSTPEFLDPNDLRVFALMSSNSATVLASNVLATTTANPPSFAFDPATMQYGVTYYIAALVGNDNGTGGVDYSDPCLKASFTNIVFYALPTVTVSGPSAICVGGTADVAIMVTGTPPFTVNYLLNGIPATAGPITTAGTTTVQLPLPATSTVTLVSVQDAKCTNTTSQSITINVNPNVEAGTPAAPLNFCEGENQTVQLFNQLIGADPGGTWTTQTGQNVANGSLNVGGLQPGANVFTYTVSGLSPCPDDIAQVTIDITERPTADAGSDETLTCDVTSVQLGIGSTTPGAAISWSGPGIASPTEPNPVVTIPGTYTLTAIIGQCLDTDEVLIDMNITQPVPSLSEHDVSCFGETDGYVIVDMVDGGLPPYLYSLDGGPFISQQSFLNLAPGSHTITVEDNAGCTSTEEFMIGEPVEVTVQLSGNFPNIDNDPIIMLGESVTISAFTTPGIGSLDTMIWSPAGIDSTCIGCPQIIVSPTQQTVYSLMVDVNGCRAEESLTVFISKDRPVFIPNAFSPNDDLVNDRLHIFAGESVTRIKSFLVFNRWGEQVYHAVDFQPAPRSYDFGWDGKHRGEFMNPGVFVWFAEVEFTDGSTQLYEGDFSLLR